MQDLAIYKNTRLPLNHYLILVLLITFSFSNSLQNSFVWDDTALIVDNPKINMPFKEIPSIFLTPLWDVGRNSAESSQSYYRPIVTLLYSLNYKLWGPNPVGFHITDILLHMMITIVLYKTGLFLFNNDE